MEPWIEPSSSGLLWSADALNGEKAAVLGAINGGKSALMGAVSGVESSALEALNGLKGGLMGDLTAAEVGGGRGGDQRGCWAAARNGRARKWSGGGRQLN